MVGSASPSAKPQRCPSDACVATTSPRSQRSPQTASPSPGSSGPLQQTQPPDHEDQENRDAPSMLASFPPASILNHKSPPSGIPSDSDFRKCALARNSAAVAGHKEQVTAADRRSEASLPAAQSLSCKRANRSSRWKSSLPRRSWRMAMRDCCGWCWRIYWAMDTGHRLYRIRQARGRSIIIDAPRAGRIAPIGPRSNCAPAAGFDSVTCPGFGDG